MSASGAPSTHDDSLDGPAAPGPREAQLVAALECDRPAGGAARFSLHGVNEVLVGRGVERGAERHTAHGYTTLHVRFPARSMSSNHARLVRAQGRWVLEDAGSRNGSFVGGERVTRALVRDRDLFELGHVLFVVRESMEMLDSPSDLDACDLRGQPFGFRTLLPSLADGFATCRRLAATGVPMLLLGETGTGKEAVAQALHALSGRRGPMVSVNCGSLPESLVEAQLFGHVRGAFSGATRDELGFVRSAHHGTLFLDEVGDLTPRSQAALLRVLQEGEVFAVGSTRADKVDVRIVSAAQRPLLTDGRSFREDLFARLAGRQFHLPPLRERIEDFGLALGDVLTACGAGDDVRLTPELGRLCLQYRWPLNFRELRQAVGAAIALSDDGVLRAKHFPSLSASATPSSRPPRVPSQVGLSDEDERLRSVVLGHLTEHQGNVRAVARTMGKAPMQIHRWMKRFGIDRRAFRPSGES